MSTLDVPPKTLYILDANALIWRAIKAPGPALRAPDGEPTAGTFFFWNTLQRLLRSRSPDLLAAARDSDRDSLVRRGIYKGYKAKRGQPEEWEKVQADRCWDILRQLQIPTIVSQGHEADDVIASLVHDWAGPEFQIYIVGKDKDLHQLLKPGVAMWDPYEEEVFDQEDVLVKWGVRPDLVPLIQALAGDSTDGIPGVRGIGEKTAKKLVRAYPDVDKLYGAELPGKIGGHLKAAAGGGFLDLMLALTTLQNDIEIPVSEEDLAWDFDRIEGVKPLIQRLGFRTRTG